MSPNRILLVYPRMGMSGALVKHMPLSILYAAVDSIKAGFTVDILDTRLDPDNWRQNLEAKITGETLLVGVSVMTGSPIAHALEISRWLKERHGHIPMVWGGPHATFNGPDTLNEPAIDYVIQSYGSVALLELARHLRGDEGAKGPADIAGLCYREEQKIRANDPAASFEFIDYRDIPYHFVEDNLRDYGQLDSGEVIFPMYSVMGCPYQCAFCSSPAQYRDIRKKYEPFSATDVVDHIEMVQRKYGATYIYFIDDDSFVRLDHVEKIIDEIERRGIKIGLGFRGARINEIQKMSDEFLTRLANVGTDIMHIGAESGSQRILDLMRKDCTVDDIVEVNRKMARHPEISTAYNWIVGLPTETAEELRETQRLMMKLVDENDRALIFIPNKFRPLPATELYDLAVEHGYRQPEKLLDWVDREAEGDYRPPWYTARIAGIIDMMQVTSYFIDGKIGKVKTGDTLKFRLIRVLAALYAPLARLRMRTGFSRLLIENPIFRFASARFQKE